MKTTIRKHEEMLLRLATYFVHSITEQHWDITRDYWDLD